MTHADVAGVGADVIDPDRLLFDEEGSKILYVGVDRVGRPAMRRCNHDGSGCTAHFLDGGRAPGSGEQVDAVIDRTGKKLLVAGVDDSSSERRLALYRCELDGTGCAQADITASRPVGPPNLAIDEARGKLYAAGCSANRPIVRQCNVDGTGCSGVALEGSCTTSSVVLDATNDKLLVVTGDFFGGTIVLHRCAPDLTGCSAAEIATTAQGGVNAAVDDASGTLFVTDDYPGQGGQSAVLIRCKVDGTDCTRRALSHPGVARPHLIRGELVIGVASGPTPQLLRCPIVGETCVSKTLSLGFYVGDTPSSADVAYDAAHDMFVLATRGTRNDTPILPRLAPIVVRQPRDNSNHHVHDISAGPGEMPYFGRAGVGGASLFDEASRKLYVLAESSARGLTDERRLHRILSRCNADGTECTFADANTAIQLLGVVDGTLVSLGLRPEYPFVPGAPENRPLEILRCSAAGADCQRTEVLSAYDRSRPLASVLDAQARRVLVLAAQPPNQPAEDMRVHLYACPLQASACAAPVALPMLTFQLTAAAFDRRQRKLVVLHSSPEGQRLARCEPDGTSCTSTIVPFTEDQTNTRMLVADDAITTLTLSASAGTGFSTIVVMRCNATGAACTTRDIAYGGSTLQAFDAVHDTETGDLLLVVDAASRARRATLLRCRADGANCSEHDMSAGQPATSGQTPTALFDPATHTVLAVTNNDATSRASLFTLTLDDILPGADGGAPLPDGGVRDGGPPADAGPPPTDAGGGGGGKTW